MHVFLGLLLMFSFSTDEISYKTTETFLYHVKEIPLGTQGYNHNHVFWGFMMVEQMFVSPEVRPRWLLVINWQIRLTSRVAQRLKT